MTRFENELLKLIEHLDLVQSALLLRGQVKVNLRQGVYLGKKWFRYITKNDFLGYSSFQAHQIYLIFEMNFQESKNHSKRIRSQSRSYRS